MAADIRAVYFDLVRAGLSFVAGRGCEVLLDGKRQGSGSKRVPGEALPIKSRSASTPLHLQSLIRPSCCYHSDRLPYRPPGRASASSRSSPPTSPTPPPPPPLCPPPARTTRSSTPPRRQRTARARRPRGRQVRRLKGGSCMGGSGRSSGRMGGWSGAGARRLRRRRCRVGGAHRVGCLRVAMRR